MRDLPGPVIEPTSLALAEADSLPPWQQGKPYAALIFTEPLPDRKSIGAQLTPGLMCWQYKNSWLFPDMGFLHGAKTRMEGSITSSWGA